MRNLRRPDEDWVVESLKLWLANKGEDWAEDESFVDNPDLVLVAKNGRRIACEITNVGINEWFRWHRDKSLRPGLGKLAAWTMPREADAWIRMAAKAKAQKAPKYLKNASADEVWLLVNGGHGIVTDFFVLDELEGYDLPLMQEELMRFKHPFTKVIVFSSQSSEQVAMVYPPVFSRPKAPDLSISTNIKSLTVRSMQVQLDSGVTNLKLGSEFTPDDTRVLPPLEKSRQKQSEPIFSPLKAGPKA